MKKRLTFLFFTLIMTILIFAGCEIVLDQEQYETNPNVTVTASETKVTEDTTVVTEDTSVETTAETATEATTEETTEVTTDATTEATTAAETTEPSKDEELPDINGTYTHVDEVALYIHTYGKLPSNFMTKNDARDLGWEGGSLENYAPGKCIGGDKFGNYEGLLPEAKGRKYFECDIDTLGAKSRGAKRIIYSNDGLIYYTDDHYESFTLLYGEE